MRAMFKSSACRLVLGFEPVNYDSSQGCVFKMEPASWCTFGCKGSVREGGGGRILQPVLQPPCHVPRDATTFTGRKGTLFLMCLLW